ncbi:glutamate ABC transporter substrate-binding protein [Myceligenerans xiligouense]|uniref:Amino acid ABC transporter substrate-binding protein (PAAT family) n=1 Tax=Myceligenerans xiligouense TaxID=253184 RepID=A0A3N4Z8Z7_9MICO|nr:glutamate ABC transporter substrate-binding protein [Myceligenerans xiligouense]RPF22348.1 amino acid ABC transporter substrate-binding protein (PAAT family) [Myceligenerans xiligouense]
MNAPRGRPGHRRLRRRHLVAVVLSGLVVVALAACAMPRAATTRFDDITTRDGGANSRPDGRTGHEPPSDRSGSPRERQECADGTPATASYAPHDAEPGVVPEGSTMERIRERGALRVGISADTLRMSARDPFTGRIEGFDIDVARAVAEAIFGDPGRVRFRVITSAQREQVLIDHEVDIVVRTFTITCERWEQVAFSAEYYHAGQKLLVPSSSDVRSIAGLDGQRVCASEETTSLALLRTWEDVEPVAAATHTQCLALFQQGRVDALTGDDTVLAGFAAQDPYAKVVGEAVSDEPYGIGVPADQVDLVRFVNAVLERRAATGGWRQSYDRWLSDVLGGAPAPPTPLYGRAA